MLKNTEKILFLCKFREMKCKLIINSFVCNINELELLDPPKKKKQTNLNQNEQNIFRHSHK